MTRYRKRPVEVDAWHFPNGSSTEPQELMPVWLQSALFAWPGMGGVSIEANGAGRSFKINTDSGMSTADPGDWIIRGTKGELYSCKPDIFAEIYEPVDDGLSFAPPTHPMPAPDAQPRPN